MTVRNCGLLLILSLLTLIQAGCIAGGDMVQANAEKFLVAENVTPELTDRILHMKQLSAEEFAEFSKSPDSYVRHLIARNPYIPKDLMARMADDVIRVKRGVASNWSITPEIIGQYLKNKKLYWHLAENPGVPEQVLLTIFHSENMQQPYLSAFACNPRCPLPIRNAIIESTNDLAKRCLIQTDQWKKEGVFDKYPLFIKP